MATSLPDSAKRAFWGSFPYHFFDSFLIRNFIKWYNNRIVSQGEFICLIEKLILEQTSSLMEHKAGKLSYCYTSDIKTILPLVLKPEYRITIRSNVPRIVLPVVRKD